MEIQIQTDSCEQLKKITPDAWRNIPKCLIDTIKILMQISINHESSLQKMVENQIKQDETNLSVSKKFAALENSMHNEISEINIKISDSFKETIKNSQAIQNEAKNQTDSLSLILTNLEQKINKSYEEAEKQRENIMKKVNELEIKSFKTKQEFTESLNVEIEKTKKELCNCPGLYGENEMYKTLGTYLMSIKKEFFDKINEITKELKTDSDIEFANIKQKLEEFNKNLENIKKPTEIEIPKEIHQNNISESEKQNLSSLTLENITKIETNLTDLVKKLETKNLSQFYQIEEEIRKNTNELKKLDSIQKQDLEEISKNTEEIIKTSKINEELQNLIENNKNELIQIRKIIDENQEKLKNDIDTVERKIIFAPQIKGDSDVQKSTEFLAMESVDRQIKELRESMIKKIDEKMANAEININRINIQIKELKASAAGIKTESNRSSIYEKLAKNSGTTPYQDQTIKSDDKSASMIASAEIQKINKMSSQKSAEIADQSHTSQLRLATKTPTNEPAINSMPNIKYVTSSIAVTQAISNEKSHKISEHLDPHANQSINTNQITEVAESPINKITENSKEKSTVSVVKNSQPQDKENPYLPEKEEDQDMTHLTESYAEHLVKNGSIEDSPDISKPQTPLRAKSREANNQLATPSLESPIKPKEILIEAKSKAEKIEQKQTVLNPQKTSPIIEEEKKPGVDKKFKETCIFL